jgi:hypothetical protein
MKLAESTTLHRKSGVWGTRPVIGDPLDGSHLFAPELLPIPSAQTD